MWIVEGEYGLITVCTSIKVSYESLCLVKLIYCNKYIFKKYHLQITCILFVELHICWIEVAMSQKTGIKNFLILKIGSEHSLCFNRIFMNFSEVYKNV